MLIAFRNGRRMTAAEAGRGATGICPWTRREVKAHVGPKEQYWAFTGGEPDFGDGYERDTPWHLAWKSILAEPNIEAVVNDRYMADIYIPGEVVVELQREPLSETEAKARAAFYKEVTGERCVYLCDITEFWRERFRLGDLVKRNTYLVDWKPRRAWLWSLAETPDANCYLDFNHTSDKLLKVWVFKGDMYAAFVKKAAFIDQFLSTALKPEFAHFKEDAAETVINASG